MMRGGDVRLSGGRCAAPSPLPAAPPPSRPPPPRRQSCRAASDGAADAPSYSGRLTSFTARVMYTEKHARSGVFLKKVPNNAPFPGYKLQ